MAAKTAKKPKPAAPADVPAPVLPAPPAAHADTLPLARLRPSPENPRKTFDDLDGLAASIRAHGLLQPILVRPLGKAPKLVKDRWEGVDWFEVVAGERRFRAAALAGLDAVSVTVRVLTDEQARPLRHVENEQRADVRLSETAAAYARLAETLTVEQIGATVGKPVGYVRGLCRLARLPAWALAAVDAGTLPRATAELVARVPGEESRKRAAACVLWSVTDPSRLGSTAGTADWEKDIAAAVAGDHADEFELLSYRDTKQLIGEHFTRQLKGSPFNLKMADLVPAAGSCDACPKRAGNDPEAKADGVRADVCLDPDCYRQKLDAHDEAERARFRKRFKLEPDADVNPDGAALDGERPARGWLDWNGTVGGSEIAADLHPKLATRKVSEVVLECPIVHGCGVNLVLDGMHRPRVLVKTADARKTLTAAGVIKKPERAKPAPKKVPFRDDETFDPAALQPKADKPLLVDELPAEEKAAEIGARILGEMAAGDCGDVDAAAVALRQVARFLIRDHCEFGIERRKHVTDAFGLPPETAYGEKAFQAKADDLTPAEVLGLCVRLTAAVVLEGEGGAKVGFGHDLLEWGQLDWPQLLDQARRELAGGPTADERLDAAEAESPPIDEQPDRNTLEGGLHQAIHTYERAAERWAKVKAAGATDAELREQIGEAFGTDGGSSGPGLKPINYKGGKSPAFWFDTTRAGKPTLAGKPLVDKVREVLGIPLPGAVSAPAACDADPLTAAPDLAVTPIPVGTLLQDLDVPDAVLDLLDARKLYGVAETWAACEEGTSELAALPPRNRLMAWLVGLEAKADKANQAAGLIAAEDAA